MTWRVATSLEVLRDELDARAPSRSKVSDGSIGDAAHATRESDHNPWVLDADGVGVVRARDFTHDPDGGLDGDWLAAALLAAMDAGHPAMGPGSYIIWDRRIVSRNRREEGWREYLGNNPHDRHLHVSVTTEPRAAGYDSRTPWLAEPARKHRDADKVLEIAHKHRDARLSVRRLKWRRIARLARSLGGTL